MVNLLDVLQIPTNRLDLFIRSVGISSYLPGRVRLYSRHLVGNEALGEEIRQRLGAFAEIDAVETSTLTGSILIHYQPERLRRNKELRKVELYIMTHVRRR